jgi:predicted SAM-dependent methyltransferase
MKLNIGSGETRYPGFTPWDIKDGKPAYPLAVPDNSVEEIYASHVLEHFSFRQTLDVLRDWCRALQPGGRLRVAVPDLDFIAQAYSSGEPPGAPIEGWLMGGQVDEHDQHRSVWTLGKLVACLLQAGFERPAKWAPVLADCASLPVSCNVQAFKPAAVPAPVPVSAAGHSCPALPVPPPALPAPAALPSPVAARGSDWPRERWQQIRELAQGIRAAWTTPRYALTPTVDCIYRSLPLVGIPVMRGAGVFWDQNLERIMQKAIAEGATGILTLDYDSVWEPADLARLIELFRAAPADVAAVCACQWARSADKPLWQRLDAEGRPLPWPSVDELRSQQLVDVTTAHFGLTLFRPAALAKLPRPWLHHQPAPDGSWDPCRHNPDGSFVQGKRDADIRFWLALRAAGCRVCIAPEVTIGHIEEVICWPFQGQPGTGRHQYVFDYYDAGRPADVMPATLTPTPDPKHVAAVQAAISRNPKGSTP